jgi:hypothetical protein
LLRACHQRPRCSTAKKRDELAPSHYRPRLGQGDRTKVLQHSGRVANVRFSGQNPVMSANVQKRTLAGQMLISAKCQKADIPPFTRLLVGTREQRRGHCDAEHSGGLGVDDQLEL